jgi:nucleoside-diphosphate-sugar epimerase
VEGTILRDADILEQLGAIGILRVAAKIGRDTRYPTFTDAAMTLRKSLAELPGKLHLDSAKTLAKAKNRSPRDFPSGAGQGSTRRFVLKVPVMVTDDVPRGASCALECEKLTVAAACGHNRLSEGWPADCIGGLVHEAEKRQGSGVWRRRFHRRTSGQEFAGQWSKRHPRGGRKAVGRVVSDFARASPIWSLDLKDKDSCMKAAQGAEVVFQLAADMGGMGFIENNKALCMLSVLTNTHMLMAAREKGVERFFYASSACVYNGDKQKTPDVVALKEEDAYPALPEDGYGWEKLFSERMCRHFEEDFGLQCRVARYHNVYGPLGTWTGGREKAPAAICRKVIEAKASGKHEIEIWGDGKQTRSFMYIDDCTRGTQAILESEIHEPINLGSSELVTINQLVRSPKRSPG